VEVIDAAEEDHDETSAAVNGAQSLIFRQETFFGILLCCDKKRRDF
jgi:hypothetical protein